MDPSFSEIRNFFRGSERLAVLNFHTLKTQGSPTSAHHFRPFFGVPVTSFMRSLGRKVTGLVRVYASPKTKFSLLATFCSRILLIWQYGSVIFRNSQLFWGSERLAVLNFHTLKTLNIGCSLALRARGRARNKSLRVPLHRMVRFSRSLQGSRIFLAVRKG